MERLLLKDINQDMLDDLFNMGSQRAVYAACITGLMGMKAVDEESLHIKRTVVETIGKSIMMGIAVHDEIQLSVNHAILDFINEQLEIDSLLNDI